MPLWPPAVASSWQVSSFSETRAQQLLQQKPAQYLRFNQRQLSRIYPSSYRVDSSNYNPQPFWNAGCQMGACAEPPWVQRPRGAKAGGDAEAGGHGGRGGCGGQKGCSLCSERLYLLFSAALDLPSVLPTSPPGEWGPFP